MGTSMRETPCARELARADIGGNHIERRLMQGAHRPERLIRRASHADAARISEIRLGVRENRLSDPLRITAADLLWFIDGPGVFVAEQESRTVGFSAADPRNGWLWALFVDAAAEGRGVGRALITPAMAVLRDAGFRAARLSTQAGSRADRFYRRDGWTAIGLYGQGQTLFEKRIGDGPRKPAATQS